MVVPDRGFAAVRFQRKDFSTSLLLFPFSILRLIKKELILDFLQMSLSKQINSCGVNTPGHLKSLRTTQNIIFFEALQQTSQIPAAYSKRCAGTVALMRHRCADTYNHTTVYSVSVFTPGSTPSPCVCTGLTVTSPSRSAFSGAISDNDPARSSHRH